MALGEYLGAGSDVTKGLYHLNGNANDSSGNSLNGTATNISWVGGKIGSGAARFTRSSLSKIDMGTSTTLQPTTALTFSIWIKIANLPAHYCAIGGNVLSGVARGYILDLSINGIMFNIGDGSWALAKTSLSVVPNNIWHNLVGTRNGTTVSFYINGSLVATAAKTGINYSGCGFALGTYRGGDVSANMFDGDMDEAIVENRAWTATEVQKYYTYAKGRFGIT